MRSSPHCFRGTPDGYKGHGGRQEGTGVASQEGAHGPREEALPRPDQEVGVVGEEGPGVHRPGPLLGQDGDARDEVSAVGVVFEDAAALSSSHHHMKEDSTLTPKKRPDPLFRTVPHLTAQRQG
jgi:hypothetical protein